MKKRVGSLAVVMMFAVGMATRAGTAPEGGGAVAQPVPGRLNVRDFGAVGDGKHDDTEALQRAIDGAWVEGDFSPRLFNIRFGPGRGPNGKNRFWSGTVYIPTGVYRTSKPLVLHAYATLIGDETGMPFIVSSAKAAFISGEGPWDPKDMDWESSGKWHTGSDREHAETGAKYCCHVTLRNLDVRGKDYGFHTLQVHTSNLHIENCRISGGKAGFVSTGFVMGSRFEDSHFTPAMWFIEEPGEKTPRFNTSVIRDCVINARGEEWALVLKGCVQAIEIKNLTLESAKRGILLDAHRHGVTVSMDGIWNFDARRDVPPELLRVEAAEGFSISNVMGLDSPSVITFSGPEKVRQVYMQNILAKEIRANGVKVVAVNCPPITQPGAGSVINGESVSDTVVPAD